jgi:IS30 family transposase
MKQYTQLSQEERYDIQAALKSKTSVTELSRTLNRSRSTIYRERSRNQGKRGYRAKQAQELSKARHYKRISAVTEFGKGYIECSQRLDGVRDSRGPTRQRRRNDPRECLARHGRCD